MKLWQKDNTPVSELIEKFTVGRDQEFDLLLARYDVQGSIAHVTMLGEVGLMEKKEAETAVNALQEIAGEIESGRFTIDAGVEDVHSQVELMLTKRIGDIGKKIHSGRSRNDQVAVDIKLYLRAEVLEVKKEAEALFELLLTQSEKFKDKLLPGYTHLQIAMPSSFGLWFGAYAESLVDDLEVLAASYAVANKNPLGSGAGYGSSFPLNRTRTTELLQFSAPNFNSVYAQMTRGKTEKIVAMGLSSLAATLGRLAMDCCLYLNQNFGFISFPSELTTGSSIFKEINDASTVANAICSGRVSTKRALVCSITTTRGSLRSFQCRMPLPTSIAYTFNAPRCNRQSVKPPVDEPTSAQTRPFTLIPNACSAASSFSPPRETKRGPESTVSTESVEMAVAGLSVT